MMPNLIHKIQGLFEFVFPGECLDEMLIKLNIFHPQCASIALSRGLGLGITAASLLLFIPQIIKIHMARSGRGISILSQLLGLVACFGTFAYSYANNFVFSQWGDSLFIFVQMIVVVMQILYFDSKVTEAIGFLIICCGTVLGLIYHYIPLYILTLLQGSTIFIVAASKLVQVYECYKNGSTGELSFVSVTLQFLGCLARIFTSVKETGDILVIVSYVVASILNGIIFSQFFVYWNAGSRKKMKSH